MRRRGLWVAAVVALAACQGSETNTARGALRSTPAFDGNLGRSDTVG